ncbi:uncharacterized protein [Ptychodera flava]|uniref:uncharacterized protein n=1 Tax=Ptychodera flava TaxID=63121 RepID=UPI00396A7059
MTCHRYLAQRRLIRCIKTSIPAEDYTEDTAIAKGAFGVVYKIRHNYSDAVFAMKEGKVDAHLVSPISEALAVHTGSGHPNILKCIEHFYDSNIKKMCIVTDFCDGGNLENYIIDTDPSDQVTLALMRQMADAIRFAHKNGIVHGDIKPGNVLIKVENNEPIAKIADFGLGKITAPKLLTLVWGKLLAPFHHRRLSFLWNLT